MRPSAACSRPCDTRQRTHTRGASARDAAGASGGRARGFEGGCVTRRPSAACSRPCDTRQRTRHAWGVSQRCSRRQRGQGVWGFEGGCVTRRPSAACSRPCDTRQRTHTRGASARDAAGASGGRACGGSRAVASHGVHLLHVRAPATRGSARTRVGRQPEMQPAPAGAGRGGWRAVASHGDHVLHVDQGRQMLLAYPLVSQCLLVRRPRRLVLRVLLPVLGRVDRRCLLLGPFTSFGSVASSGSMGGIVPSLPASTLGLSRAPQPLHMPAIRACSHLARRSLAP